MGDGLGAGCADVVITDVELSELAVVVDELTDRPGSAVTDEVV